MKRNLNNMLAVKVTAENVKLENGQAEPHVVVKYNGMILKEGRDYTVTYRNLNKAGKATAVIKGQGNYTGTKRVKFTVSE